GPDSDAYADADTHTHAGPDSDAYADADADADADSDADPDPGCDSDADTDADSGGYRQREWFIDDTAPHQLADYRWLRRFGHELARALRDSGRPRLRDPCPCPGTEEAALLTALHHAVGLMT
ncbi:MAG: hypothetical protein ACHQ3P_06425, partial [Candidatus Limnocylindrales bacterium]